MTLGEIIKDYVDHNSMAFFTARSGLSRAYAYMLINDKNGRGKRINPTMETIQKVAIGVGLTFDEIISLLDHDYVVTVNSQGINPESSAILGELEQITEGFTEKQMKRLRNYANLIRMEEEEDV